MEELQQFRRQAEIQKIRDEVLASMPGQSCKAGECKTNCASRGARRNPAQKFFRPKPRKLCLLSPAFLAMIPCPSDEVTSWVDVKAQLSSQPAPGVRSLCAQICEHAPRNKSDCIAKIMDQLQSLDSAGPLQAQSCLWNFSSSRTDRWLHFCFLSFIAGFICGFSFADPGLSSPCWLPAPFARAVRYVQALKVIAWDDYVLSQWLQITTGIPVATASAGTLLLGYKWFSEGQATANGMRKWVHDVAQTPIRRAKRLSSFSPGEGIRRVLF